MAGASVVSRLLAAAVVTAWLGPVASVASAQAQKADARGLLARTSKAIAGLDSFIVSGEAYTDAWLDAGLVIEHSADVTMKVRRPGEMRLTNRDSETTKEIFFGGGVLTVFNRSRNFYAQKEIPGDAGAAFDYAVNELGIDAPLLDFVSKDIAGLLLKEAQEVRYLGTSLMRGRLFDHVAIRDPEVDIQIWIAAEGPPLPGKMTITSKWKAGSPRFVAFLDWDTSPNFPSDALVFVAPEGATRIEFELDLDAE
jgi:hypothetical protein